MTNAPWARFPPPRVYAPSITGAPFPGARLYFYETGTATPMDTYSDQGRTIPNSNPVVADQGGNFPDIFLSDASYRVVLTDSSGDEQWTADPVSPYVNPGAATSNLVTIPMVVAGGGSVPSTGIVCDFFLPFALTITQSILQATGSGSLVLDIWAETYANNNPPTAANSIVASAPPTLSSAQSSSDSTLTGWTKKLPAGTSLRYNLTSISTITQFTHTLVGTA